MTLASALLGLSLPLAALQGPQEPSSGLPGSGPPPHLPQEVFVEGPGLESQLAGAVDSADHPLVLPLVTRATRATRALIFDDELRLALWPRAKEFRSARLVAFEHASSEAVLVDAEGTLWRVGEPRLPLDARPPGGSSRVATLARIDAANVEGGRLVLTPPEELPDTARLFLTPGNDAPVYSHVNWRFVRPDPAPWQPLPRIGGALSVHVLQASEPLELDLALLFAGLDVSVEDRGPSASPRFGVDTSGATAT